MDKYRKSFILSQPGVDFVPFAVETYGTSCREAQEFLEWMGHLAYPLQEVVGKIVDVDGGNVRGAKCLLATIAPTLLCLARRTNRRGT
jgi:hypothetical protein